jgi:hypothetical protein
MMVNLRLTSVFAICQQILQLYYKVKNIQTCTTLSLKIPFRINFCRARGLINRIHYTDVESQLCIERNKTRLESSPCSYSFELLLCPCIFFSMIRLLNNYCPIG